MAYNYHMGASMLGPRSMRNGAYRAVSSGGLPKLKSLSSVTNTKSSISRSLLMNQSSIQSTLSQLFQTDVSDVSAVSSKASSAMTKDYVAALEAQAKSDAEAGTYGKDGKAAELRDKQMEKYVSPDRDAAIAQVSKLLTSGSMVSAKVKLTGLPYTVSITKGRSGTTAELYDEYGEKFASYDSKSGQWKSVATKAETQFKTASSSIYDEAYRAAQPKSGGAANSGASSLDVRT